jgi:hypothetical protein
VPVTGHAIEHRFVRPDNPFDHALVELPPAGRDHTDLFAALWTFDTVDGQVTDDLPGGCHVVMWIQGGDHRFPDYELDGGSLTPDEVRRVIGMSAHHLRHERAIR